MGSLLIITVQIVLAFYIISTIYMVMVYYLKEIFTKNEIENLESTCYSENHLAIVYTNYCTEAELIKQIQELNAQDYQNFCAYFFVDEPLVTYNGFSNIKIIRPSGKKYSNLGLLELAKSYFDEMPVGVITLKTSSTMNHDFLKKMNNSLLQGKNVVQCQIQIENSLGEIGTYQSFARKFFNLIDREALQASGVSAALWKEGFMIENSLFHELNFNDYQNNNKGLQANFLTKSVKIEYNSEAKIIEKVLDEEEFLVKQKNGFQYYIYNLNLGFQLILEGFKNPNMDKLIFGFNYLRPPLLIMLVSSIVLAAIDIIWMPKLAMFIWISLLGIISSLILLLNPIKIFKLYTPIKISIGAYFLGKANKKVEMKSLVYFPEKTKFQE